jgi:DNA-binding transcriptional LysR family regulator
MVAEGYDVIIRASIQQEDSSLISRRFMKSEVITVASPNYVKKNGLPKKPTDLTHHQTISYGYLKQPKLWMYIDKNAQPIQINVDSQVTTNSGEMNLALCIAGKGVTRIPRFHLTDELTQNKLVELFDDYPQIDIDIHLVYPSRKHMSSKVRSFIDFVVAELGD